MPKTKKQPKASGELLTLYPAKKTMKRRPIRH